MQTHQRATAAEAVLAHELAHIARRDWLTLLLARLAVAIFWFNPLVWLIERAAMHEAEEAADHTAISRVDPSDYAQTLLDFAKRARPKRIVANSIASGRLSRRVAAVLDARCYAAPSPRRVSTAMTVCLALAAPVAAMKFIPTQVEQVFELDSMRGVVTSVPNLKAARPKLETLVAATLGNARQPAASGALRPAAQVAGGPQQQERDELARPLPLEAAARHGPRVNEGGNSYVRLGPDGRRNMLRSAANMERHARQMLDTAANLRSSEYRARKIAAAARKGRVLTHEQLTDTISGLEQGAQGMFDGAQGMRAHVEAELSPDST